MHPATASPPQPSWMRSATTRASPTSSGPPSWLSTAATSTPTEPEVIGPGRDEPPGGGGAGRLVRCRCRALTAPGGQAADLVALVALAAGVWALPAPTSGETVSTTALTSSCCAEISETTKSYCESITSTGLGSTSGYVTLGTRPSAYSTPLLT